MKHVGSPQCKVATNLAYRVLEFRFCLIRACRLYLLCALVLFLNLGTIV